MMATYQIEGARPLTGHTKLPGAKNAVTKVMVASLLSKEPSVIKNVPPITEIDLTLSLLQSLGAKIERNLEKGEIRIERGENFSNVMSFEKAAHNRLAVLVLPPLLHSFGEVRLPLAMGGDRIGPRPIDFHLKGFMEFGAKVDETESEYLVRCEKLKGTKIELPYPSVSTTENLLMAASLAEGTTVLRGAAIEPEVIDLVLFLQKMGAIIELRTDRTFVIEGVRELSGTTHSILPDRISCASFGALALATGGKIEVEGARQGDMITFLNTLRRMNAPFEVTERGIIFGNGSAPRLKPIHLETDVHPGFMTDWQPPLVILMTQAEGMSVLHETVYENRLGYIKVLKKMGASVELSTRCMGGTPCRFQYHDHTHSCIVKGSTPLINTDVEVPDLRAGFSYVIAALCARGQSLIRGIEQIERGYGNLHHTLESLGAHIERIDN